MVLAESWHRPGIFKAGLRRITIYPRWNNWLEFEPGSTPPPTSMEPPVR